MCEIKQAADAFKSCPTCDFRAAVNARACARCGGFFADAAPLSVRDWIRGHARKARVVHPDWDSHRMTEYLEARLLHDQGLLREVSQAEERDPAALSRPSPGLLQEFRDWVEEAWHHFVGDDPPVQVRKIRWAIQEAVEDVFSRDRSLGVTPWS